MRKIIIRPAVPGDIGAITRIYADAVLNGTASFEIEPPDQSEMLRRQTALLKNHYPYFAAEIEGLVAGYAYAGPYRMRPAYNWSVEDSVYVTPQCTAREWVRYCCGLSSPQVRSAATGR